MAPIFLRSYNKELSSCNGTVPVSTLSPLASTSTVQTSTSSTKYPPCPPDDPIQCHFTHATCGKAPEYYIDRIIDSQWSDPEFLVSLVATESGVAVASTSEWSVRCYEPSCFFSVSPEPNRHGFLRAAGPSHPPPVHPSLHH